VAGNQILLIDADLASRSYLSAALEKKGYPTLQAGSGREGLIAAWRDRPALIIADPVTVDLPGEELAARLRADPRSATIPLIAMSSDPAAERQLSCMQAGFGNYLVKGPQAVSYLLKAVGEWLQPAPKTGGLLIAFVSAKGGTGTSSVCANIATNLAQAETQARIAVVDLVLPIGSIAGIVGYAGDQNLITLASLPPSETTPEFLRENLRILNVWRFYLLAGSSDPDRGNELTADRVEALIDALRVAYDFVLLDLGRSLSRLSLSLIDEADLVAMILGVDTSTVSLTRIVWDFLRSRGVQPSSVFLILNRAVGLEGLTRAEAEKTVGLPIQSALPYLGGNLSLANNQHQPYSLKFPGDTASITFRETGQQMAAAARRLRAG
jgi:pilus assembly protein CpaE